MSDKTEFRSNGAAGTVDVSSIFLIKFYFICMHYMQASGLLSCLLCVCGCVCVHMGVSALCKLLMGDGLCSNEEFTKSQFGVKQVTKWCRHLCSIAGNHGVSFCSRHSV